MDKIKIFGLLIMVIINLGIAKNSLFAESQFDEMKKLEEAEREVAIKITRPRVEYRASGLKDPFRLKAAQQEQKPGTEIKAAPPDLKIQGLVWGAENPQAIVNEKVVNIGDIVDGVRIVDITKEGIDVFFEGRQFKISSPASAYYKEKAAPPEGG